MMGKKGGVGTSRSFWAALAAVLVAEAAALPAAAVADPEPVGAAFKVNAATLDGDQGAPDVAVSGSNFVAVWEGEDADGKGIYARGFDAKGNPFALPALVNSSTDHDQERPAVASRHNGDFVIVWQGKDVETRDPHIYAASFTAAGVPLSGEIRVDQARARTPGAPAVAVAPGGDFLVVWQSHDADPDGDGTDISYRLFEADGDPLGGENTLNVLVAGDQTNPAVAAMGAETSSGFYAVWEGDDADDGGIYLQHLDLAAEPQLLAELLVNSSSETGAQRDPAVAVSAIEPDKEKLNRVAVVWEGPHSESERIWYRLFDLAGQPAATETLVDTDLAALAQRDAAVALPATAPEGLVQLVTTYTQSAPREILGDPSVIVGARRPRGSIGFLPEDPEFPISAVGPVTGDSRIAMDPDAGFVTIWQEAGPQGVGLDLYARRYAPTVFKDGFESGSTLRWSLTSP